MFPRIAVAAVAALCVQATFAQSVKPAYSPAYSACQAKSGGVDQAMLDCISAEYALQDKRLNDSYKALLAQMAPRARAALKAAQLDWIRSQKSTCKMYYTVSDGSAAHLRAQSCYLSSLVERVSSMEDWKFLYEHSR